MQAAGVTIPSGDGELSRRHVTSVRAAQVVWTKGVDSPRTLLDNYEMLI
jgi:hypothetical protein